MAKLPLDIYKRWKGGKRVARGHRAHYLLRRKPNPAMTAFQWKLVMALHKLLTGNAYSYIYRAGDGSPQDLLPLSPDKTYPERRDGKLWIVTAVDQGQRKLPIEDVLHFKGISYDGLIGYNIMTKMREALGLGMGQQTYASMYFNNNAEPRIVLKHPGKLSEQAKTNLRESWERMHVGLTNAHRTAILAEGMDVKQVSLSARDSQMIESRKYSLIEVANFFGIPPYKVGAEISTSYKSLEQMQQAYLDEALDPWLVSDEEECWDKLLTEDEKQRETHEVLYSREELLRADLETRTKFYESGLMNGYLNVDEVRDDINKNPLPNGEGQTHRYPLNMTGAGAEGKPVEGATAGTPTPEETELIDVPDIRQLSDYDCGPAAVLSVARYFGVDGGITEPDLIAALATSRTTGTPARNMVDWLTAKGLVATSAVGLDVEDLRRFFLSDHPAICEIQAYGTPQEEDAGDSGHYVVVIGVGLGQVFFQDPSAGRQMVTEAEWLAAWHSVNVLADGTAVPIQQFGIAVGEDLIDPPPEEDDGDGDDETEPPTEGEDKPDEGAQRQKLAGLLRPILEAELRRAVKRIGTHARRQAKDSKKFGAWLESFSDEHRGTIADSLAHTLSALSSLRGQKVEAQPVADDLLKRLAAPLTTVTEQCTARELEARVEQRMTELESFLPELVAGELLEAK